VYFRPRRSPPRARPRSLGPALDQAARSRWLEAVPRSRGAKSSRSTCSWCAAAPAPAPADDPESAKMRRIGSADGDSWAWRQGASRSNRARAGGRDRPPPVRPRPARSTFDRRHSKRGNLAMPASRSLIVLGTARELARAVQRLCRDIKASAKDAHGARRFLRSVTRSSERDAKCCRRLQRRQIDSPPATSKSRAPGSRNAYQVPGRVPQASRATPLVRYAWYDLDAHSHLGPLWRRVER
jgi:hypothetical protein